MIQWGFVGEKGSTTCLTYLENCFLDQGRRHVVIITENSSGSIDELPP